MTNVTEFPQTNEPKANTGALADMSQECIDDIKAAVASLEGIKDERETLNAKAKQVKSGLTSKYGINQIAFLAACAFVRLPEDKRENFDLSYRAARHALGHPVQDDLFEEALKRDIERSRNRRRSSARQEQGSRPDAI